MDDFSKGRVHKTDGFWNVFLLLLKIKRSGRLFRQIRYIEKKTRDRSMKKVTSKFPFGSSRQWSASSISVHPGGSTLQTAKCRRSTRFLTSYSKRSEISVTFEQIFGKEEISVGFFHTSSVRVHGIVGRHANTASENLSCCTSCSSSSTSFSAFLSPTSPSRLT